MANLFVESFYEDCLLVHLDSELSARGGYEEFIQKTDNLISVLEDLALKMKYISNFYLSYVSAKCIENVTVDVLKCHRKFFPVIFEPEIKDEDFSEDIVVVMQKLVHCLISSFKTTILIYQYGLNNDCTKVVIGICHKFLKYSFKAAVVFIVEEYEHNLSQNFLNDGMAAMQNLAMILIAISKYMILEIMDGILPFMLNYMVRNPLIKVFLNVLLGHRKTSLIVASALLKYFSDRNMKILEKKNSKKSSLFLSLYGDIFQALILFPDEIGIIEEKRLEKIIKGHIGLIRTDVNCYNHLCVLKTLFLAIHHDKSLLVHYGILRALPDLFNTFDFLLQTQLEYKIWCLLLETILTVVDSITSSSSEFLLSYIELITKTVIFSLKENLELLRKALHVFEIFLDNVDFDYIHSCISPLKKDLFNALDDALRNSSKGASEIACRIVGKMGGYIRDKFSDNPELHEADVMRPFLYVTFREGFNYNQFNSISFPLTKVVDYAFEGLLSFKDDSKKLHCWSIMENFLILYIDRYGVDLKKHPFEPPFLKSNGNENDSTGNEDDSTGNEHYCTGNGDYSRVLKTTFKAVCVSAQISCLSERARSFIEILIACLINFSRKGKNDLLMLLIDAELLIACLPKGCSGKIHISTLKIILKQVKECCDKTLTNSVVRYIVEKVILLLHGQTWEEKLVGCKTLQFFMELSSWEWKINHLHKFVRPLLNAIVDIDEKISVATYNIAKVTLQSLLLQCFASSDENNSKKIEKVYHAVRDSLIYELVSPNVSMRRQARSTILLMFCIAKRTVLIESKVTDKNAVIDESEIIDINSEVTEKDIEVISGTTDEEMEVTNKNMEVADENNEITDKCKVIDNNTEKVNKSEKTDEEIEVNKNVEKADENNEITDRSKVIDNTEKINKSEKNDEEIEVNKNMEVADENNEITDKSKVIDNNTEKINKSEETDQNIEVTNKKISVGCKPTEKFKLILPRVFYLLTDYLVYLHEDFDFCLKLETPLFEADIVGRHRILYSELKSLCIVKERIVPAENDVKQYCGALHTLCFNFIKEQNLEEVFKIFTNALLSSIPEISESAVKCLQIFQSCVSPKKIFLLLRDWTCDFLNPLYMDYPLYRQELYQVKHLVKIFGSKLCKKFLCSIMRHLRMWKIRTINVFKTIYRTKIHSSTLATSFNLGAEMINVLNLMQITDKYIIKEVMGTMFEIERYFKVTESNPLKEPFMTFCRRSPMEVVQILISNLMYNDKAGEMYYEDFLKTEDCNVFRLSIKESYLINIRKHEQLNYILQILRYIVKYDNRWLSDKTKMVKILRKEWNTDKLFCNSRLQAVSCVKDFKLIAKLLLNFFNYNQGDFNLLFHLMKAFVCPFASSFNFLKDFILNIVVKKYSITWKAAAFYEFQSFFTDIDGSDRFKIVYLTKVLQFLFIPSFSEAFMKGEGEELLKNCNERNSVDILKHFLCCVRNLFHHSEKVKLMFLKFSILMAQNVEILDHYEIFIKEAKSLAESSLTKNNILGNNVRHSCLLLLIIKEDTDINVLKVILPKLFISYSSDDQYSVQQALYICLSYLPGEEKRILSQCFQLILDRRYFEMLVQLHETFYLVRHNFITKMVQVALQLEAFKDLKHLKIAIDLIEVIINWGKQYLKAVEKSTETEIQNNIIGAADAQLAVNFLLRIACCVDSDLYQKSISKRSISLLKDVFQQKIFLLTGLEFEDWVDDLLRKISEQPKQYENCEIFALMTSFFPHLTEITLKSFVKHLQNNIKDLLKSCSGVKVLESLYSFLSNLIPNFPPEKFKPEFYKLYEHIDTMCSQHCLINNTRARLVEAVGRYFPSCLKDLNINLINSLKLLSENYSLKVEYDNKITLNVALGFLKEVFFDINEDDRKKLFDVIMHQLIKTVSHDEIMLKIIDVMELSVKYLKQKEDGKLLLDLVNEICDKIRTNFSHNEAICARFSELISELREDIDDARINNIFAVFGTFTSDSEIREEYFNIVAKELHYELFLIVSYICDERWKFYDSFFWIRMCINLISVIFKDVHILSNIAHTSPRTKAYHFFKPLVELCYSDEILAKYLWTELFPYIYNMENEEERKVLFERLWSFILIPSEKYNPVFYLNDVFIKTAFKCNPEFFLHIDSKHICESYYLQVYCSLLLERCVFSVEFLSVEEHAKVIRILSDIYTEMEESDVLNCFKENYTKYNPSTVQAVSSYKMGSIFDANEFYRLSEADFNDDCRQNITEDEMQFSVTQMIRCASQLATWDDSTDNLASESLMQYVCPRSKYNVLMKSPLEKLIMQSEFCKLKNEDMNSLKDEEIYNVIFCCIKKWKSLPQSFQSQNHYSLLQLMQQLTELLEANHLVKNKHLNMFAEKVKNVSSRWDSRPYLLSDDFSFITELLNVRQRSLENIALSSDDELYVKYIANIATHASNNYAIKLHSAAVKFQNTVTKNNIGCKEYSVQNAYQLLELMLSNLLSDAKKSVTITTGEDLFKKAHDLCAKNGEIIKHFDKERQFALQIYQNEIFAALGFEITENINRIVFESPRISKAYLIQAEYWEKCFYKNPTAKNASAVLFCLLKACRFGTVSECLLLIPKFIYFLEFDDDKNEIATEFSQGLRCDIPDKCWISFLPFLMSCLQHSIKEEKLVLSSIFTDVLLRLSLKYPQQVFFSIQSLRGIPPEKRCMEKCEEIVWKMRERHPILTFKLEEIRKHFGLFKINTYDVYFQMMKASLDKAYYIILQNFKSGRSIFDGTEIISYLKEDFLPKLQSIDGLSAEKKLHQLISHFAYIFKSLEGCTPEIIIGRLKKYIGIVSEWSTKFESRSFVLQEKCPLLSSRFLENEAYIFDQSHLVDDESLIRIHKLHPKVDVIEWNNTFVHKINIYGNDGKIYSYFIMKDTCRIESIDTVKLMQLLENINPLLRADVQCSKRFFKFHFPRVTFINSHLKLVPHQNAQIPLQNVHQMHAIVESVLKLFTLHPDSYKNKHYLHNIFKSIQYKAYEDDFVMWTASEDDFVMWTEKLYSSSSMDYYNFRKQILKEISVLAAAEFLNICSKKQMLIHKNSGLMSATHLELTLEELQTTSCLLTPYMKKFLEPLMKVLAENVLHILSCIRKNEESWKFIRPLMHLMKKRYSKEVCSKMEEFVNMIVNRLICVDINEVQRFLESSTWTSFDLCHADIFVHVQF